jgi:phosphohistidine phosphatase
MAKIYLMRHSQSAPADFRTTDDARWLTSKGRSIASDAGRALAQEISGGAVIDTIVTSPLSRTVQTAELVAQALGWQAEIHCLSSLRSESSPQRAIEELLELPAEVVLAVTHEPIVSSMCALLSGQSIKDFQSGFRPAEISCISEGSVTWRWRD